MFLDLSGRIAHNPPALHAGVAVADVDGDGRFEFVVAGAAGPNRVLKWAGGMLRDVAPPEVADPDRRAVAIAAGDLDGDGIEELFILNASPQSGTRRGGDRLLKRGPDGRWDDLLAHPGGRPAVRPGAGRGVATIDRRGGGRYGFVVAADGPPQLHELGPGGSLADLAAPLALAGAVGCQGVLVAPLTDGHTDLFLLALGGPNRFFRNRGDGRFDECGDGLNLADAGEHSYGAVAVDADGDGRLDLCGANVEGPHRLLVRQPDGGWRDRATPGLALPSPARAVVAADFDNDGHDELFFNNLGEPNRVFRLLANGRHESAGEVVLAMLDPGDAAAAGGFGTGAAVADIDGDGVLELLVAHGVVGAQPLGLYKARAAAGNGWLRIRPQTRFGAPARGAQVRAEFGDRVRVKVIDGGSGGLCQMEPTAHFGLGREAPVERVTVTWPDGAALTMRNPDLNCSYTVPYPRG